MKKLFTTGVVAFGFLSSVWAQDQTFVSEDLSENPKYKIIVTDEAPEEFISSAGNPQRISKEKVNLYKYTDVNRVLRQSTGVYVREEDGQGLRPNIGLRGTNPDRSKKIVFMEDGVLIGPAPYSAPAAYYTPFMNNVESLEVFKGFTAVPYGPNSIGGAINYKTFSIPTEFTPKAEYSAGAFNTQNIRLGVGDSGSVGGYLVQVSRITSDGFKKLDGGGDVGFEKNDILLKGRLNLPSFEGSHQYLEARLGYAEEESNETYLGLSPDDFSADPFRRYSSSALDKMSFEHTKAHLEHNLQWGSSNLKTTVYRHDFHRLWYRLDGFRGGSTPLFFIVNDPAAYSQEYRILTGLDDSSAVLAGAGDLNIAGNDRNFYSQGVQTKWNGYYQWGETQHEVEVGLRFHMDQIRRNHYLDTYSMEGGALQPTGDVRTMAAINSQRASVWTLHFLENMSWNRWVFTVLGRVENVKYRFENVLGDSLNRRGDSVFAPGAGALYKLTDNLSVKGSVNRGVSVAGLNDIGQESQERSMNYEFGLKYLSQDRSRQAEIVGFYNDYSNITGTCTVSTGCTGNQLDQQFNGGAAIIQGVEARFSQNLYYRALTFPFQLNLTYLDAAFDNSFSSSSAEWGLGTVNKGDPLPYVPKIQYTLTAGTVWGRFSHEFAFIYQKEAYDQSVSLDRREIPAFGLIDWTARYQLADKTQVFARVDNLLDKEYLVSLRPFGARPGKPQSFMVGLSHAF